jgi:hypothetical protein
LRAAVDLSEGLGGIVSHNDSPDQGYHAPVGVASGNVYAGLVGSDVRASYTVNGVATNLAARMMSLAIKSSLGVLCDKETLESCGKGLVTSSLLGSFEFKGWENKKEVFQISSSRSANRFSSIPSGLNQAPNALRASIHQSLGSLGRLNIAEVTVFGYAEEQERVIQAIRSFSQGKPQALVIQVRPRRKIEKDI